MQFEQTLSNLESQPTWSAKVGPAYNPVNSTKYWSTLLSNGWREFGHEAPAQGGWLSGLNDLPIPSGFTKGLVRHRLSLMFDASILNWTTGARILAELDNRVADGKGNNFNYSNQINLSSNWMWQVDPQTGKWTDTGVRIAPLAPFQWHDFEFENAIDFVANKLSFVSLTVNGVRYAAPAVFSNLTPMKDPQGHFWKQGANLQVQMCRQTAGVSVMWGRKIGIGWQ